MNLDTFFTYLDKPETLNRQTLDELSELNERYPYFQTSRLLYLKNLHLLNDYRYAEELKKVSAYAGSRQVLYDLIHNFSEKEIQNQELICDTESSVEIINEEYLPIIQNDSISITEEILVKQTEETNQSIEPIETSEPQEEKELILETLVIITEEKIIEPEIILEPIQIENTVEIIAPIAEEISETQFTESIESKEEAIVEEIKPVFENIQAEPILETEVYSDNITFIKSEPEIPIVEEKVPFENEIVSEVPIPDISIPEIEPIKVEDQPKAEVKESIADIIMRKVADIKSGIKEPNIPIIEKEPIKEENKTSEDLERELQIIIDEVNLAKSLKKEEKATLTEEIIRAEENIVPEINPITEIQVETVECVVTEKEESPVEIEPEKKIEPIEELPVFIPVYDVTTLLKNESEWQKNISIEEPKKEVSMLSMSFSEWLDYFAGEKQKQKKTKTFPDLIDNFISNEPRLKIQKTEPIPSQIEKDQNNSSDEFEYMSETLADIYSQQGLIEKAINMYEKLGLKYPEKKIYFASLILKLNQQNSNQ